LWGKGGWCFVRQEKTKTLAFLGDTSGRQRLPSHAAPFTPSSIFPHQTGTSGRQRLPPRTLARSPHALPLLFSAVLAHGPPTKHAHKHTGDSPTWYLGALPAIRKHGTVKLHELSRRKHGWTWASWGGSRPFIMAAHPADARALAVHNYDRPAFASVWAPGTPEAAFDAESILAARGDKHRSIRAAWLPLFFSGSLAKFGGLMNAATDELVARLTAAAAPAPGADPGSGSVVDLSNLFGDLTMQVIGEAAFGVDFRRAAPGTTGTAGDAATTATTTDPQQSPSPASVSQRETLITAIDSIFNTPGLTFSVYGAAMLFAPALRPVIHFFSRRWPDAGMRRLRAARQTIIAAVSGLIDQHVKAVEAEDKAGGETTTSASKAAEMARRSGVAPGSFLDVCVRARDKATGARLSPLCITNQAFVCLLAGYETTNNALAYTAYCLSKPENAPKLRKVLAEVDAFFGGDQSKPVTAADVGVAVGGSVTAPGGGEGGAFPYLRACLWEAMRLYPPAPIVAREAAADTSLTGPAGTRLAVKKGWWLAVPVYALHRDPDLWTDPTAFIPERWVPGTPEAAAVPPHGWMAFGAGPRVCVGWRLAVTEAVCALAKLYSAVTLTLEPGQDPLPLRATITMSPKNGVKVRPVLRAGAAAVVKGGGGGVDAAVAAES
jgi:cytochrome P450